METRIDKFNESKRMSRVAKNIDLYKEINDTELDNFMCVVMPQLLEIKTRK